MKQNDEGRFGRGSCESVANGIVACTTTTNIILVIKTSRIKTSLQKHKDVMFYFTA